MLFLLYLSLVLSNYDTYYCIVLCQNLPVEVTKSSRINFVAWSGSNSDKLYANIFLWIIITLKRPIKIYCLSSWNNNVTKFQHFFWNSFIGNFETFYWFPQYLALEVTPDSLVCNLIPLRGTRTPECQILNWTFFQ